MIPDSEIAAARAALPGLLPMRLKRAGPLLVGLCPFHNEKTPSFTVYPDWHFFCFGCCAKGDAISWVQRTKGLAFPDAVRQLIGRTALGNTVTPRYQTRAPRETEVPSLVLNLWRTGTAPRLASMYLDTRGVPQKTLPAALRGHERVWCQEAGEYRPAMIAAITDAAGQITAIQRTFVERRIVYDGHTNFAKGARAADLKNPKLSLGPMGNGAVKLAAAGEVLGLAEGNESALAAARLFRLPVWALCGLSRCGRPAGWSEPKDDRPPHWLEERSPNIDIPKTVRRVIFFGDNGKIGHKIADFACSWWCRQGLPAQAEYPDDRYEDWCEAIR